MKDYPIAGPQESGALDDFQKKQKENLGKELPKVKESPKPEVKITLSDEEIKQADRLLTLRTGVNWMLKTGMPTPQKLVWGAAGALVIAGLRLAGCF